MAPEMRHRVATVASAWLNLQYATDTKTIRAGLALLLPTSLITNGGSKVNLVPIW